ncbi:GDYXXLXY domain-containing protein [bacterium]|nr:GDYXXLXY domain-containing protein [bacterium]
MKTGKNMLIIGAVLVQLIALASMCLQREAVLATGNTVYIRTEPVDPRDMFRGDYVQLQYEISSIPIDMVPEQDREEMQKRHSRVYLAFTTDRRSIIQPLHLSLKKPEQGLFIRGLIEREYFISDLTSQDHSTIDVRYGIEKYFMQQGKALEIETGKRFEGVMIPLEMEVAIGKSNGIAVLKDYRYAEMGMDIKIPERRQEEEDLPFIVNVKIVNTTERPLAIVDPAGHDTFTLELSQRFKSSAEPLRILNQSQPSWHYQADDIKMIAPSAVYAFYLNLSDPRFRLARGDKPVGFHEMEWNEQARILYAPPPSEKIAHLPGTGAIWDGRLRSRTFSSYNIVD